MDDKLVSDTARAEGCKLTAYQDTLGYWTAGYGHKLPLGRDFTNVTYSTYQVEEWLNADLQEAQEGAAALPEWKELDTLCRQNAVTELCFNMGLGHWCMFKLCRAAIARTNWREAHNQLLTSKWADEVGPERAQRLASYLLTGAYP